jgi:hypothetical protein
MIKHKTGPGISKFYEEIVSEFIQNDTTSIHIEIIGPYCAPLKEKMCLIGVTSYNGSQGSD